jgi:hypothetical protein
MSISFEALVHHPDQILPQVAGFLSVADKLSAMHACIHPALHRTAGRTFGLHNPPAGSGSVNLNVLSGGRTLVQVNQKNK